MALDGFALRFTEAELLADRCPGPARRGSVLQYAATELWADRGFVLDAVTQNWFMLRDAATELRADRGVVLAAVTRCGGA